MTPKTNLLPLRFLQDKNNAKSFVEALLGKSIPEIKRFCWREGLSDTVFDGCLAKPDFFLEDQENNRYVIDEVDEPYGYGELEDHSRLLQSGIESDYFNRSDPITDYPESYIIQVCHFDTFSEGYAVYNASDLFDWLEAEEKRHMIILNSHYRIPNASPQIIEMLDQIRNEADEIKRQEIISQMWEEAPFEDECKNFVDEWMRLYDWGKEHDLTLDDKSSEERAKEYAHIWNVAHMGIKEIRQMAGLTKRMLSQRLDIPYVTIVDWENGEECPEYVRFMIALLLGIIKVR